MTEFTSEDGNEYHLWYDSMEELRVQLPVDINRVNAAAWSNYQRKVDLTYSNGGFGGNSWHGCADRVEAFKRADEGWPELQKRLYPLVEQLRQHIELGNAEAVLVPLRRRKRKWQDYGDTLDIHRVWSGELDKAWERPVRRNIMSPSQRHATIYIDLAMRGYLNFEASLWRAAVAYCICETLARMNISVEVWCGDTGTGTFSSGPSYTWTGVCIKPYSQPLNDDRLAVMSSATFYRTYGFGMLHGGPHPISWGMGNPWRGIVHPLRLRQAAGERVFSVGQCFNYAEAVDQINKVIHELKAGHREVA